MIKSYVLTILLLVACTVAASAQKYFSKTGEIEFLSEAPIEKITAVNQNGYLVLDGSTGSLEMSVLIKGFKFEKALMQDHFNENYMESSKYPKALFKGRIINMGTANLTKDGTYNLEVQGDLTIRGISKPLKTQAKANVSGGKISVSGNFDVAIADYGIQVPKVVRDNIAKNVKVSVSADLQKL